MTIICDIGKRCSDSLWLSYFRGDFSNGQDHRTVKSDFAHGFWSWYRYFKRSTGEDELVFPLTTGLFVPAWAARLAGKGVSIRISCHHELESASSLLLSLAGKIIPGSESIRQAILARNIDRGRVANVDLPVVAVYPVAVCEELKFDKPTVLALPTSENWTALAAVIHIAALVYNVRQDFSLLICIANESDRSKVARQEEKYNAAGMCICIDNSSFSPEIVKQSVLILNGPEYIDDPLRFLLALKMDKQIIAGARTRIDFGCNNNCQIIETEYKRQFASALYVQLKQIVDSK